MFIKKQLKYFTRPKQISPDLSGVSGDFRIVWYYITNQSDHWHKIIDPMNILL